MHAELSRATVLYKRGEHQLALDILESSYSNAALSKLPIDRQISALDLLASLSEKQGFLMNARRYARTMLLKNKNDLRGYLRLGKLYQLQGERTPQAVKVYKMALKELHPLNKQHEQFLKRQLMLCQTKLSQQKPKQTFKQTDFVGYLPIELCRLIFSHLVFKDIVKCTLVCSKWQRYLYNDPVYWSQLCLNSPNASKLLVIQSRTLVEYLKKSKLRLIDIELCGVYVKGVKAMVSKLPFEISCQLRTLRLEHISPESARLRHLQSIDLPNLETLEIGSDRPMQDIAWCLQELPKLVNLVLYVVNSSKDSFTSINNNSNLKQISITGTTNQQTLTNPFVSELVSIPSLVKIDLFRVLELWWPYLAPALENPNLKHLGFSSGSVYANHILQPMPRFSGKMEELMLSSTCIGLDVPLLGLNGEIWTRYSPDFRSTETLRLLELRGSTLHDLNVPDLLVLLGCTQYLRVLAIHSCMELNSDRHERLVFPKLEVLEYTGMKELSRARLNWMLTAFPNIKKINFDATPLYGHQLLEMLKRFTKLVTIRCSNVRDISSDTIEWCKQQTVNVQFS